MNLEIIGRCWQCGTDLSANDFGRETNCLVCGKPTKVCRNCGWYDPGSTDQCRERAADPIRDKTRANYCEYFVPTSQPVSGSAPGSSQDQLRKAAEDLFKN